MDIAFDIETCDLPAEIQRDRVKPFVDVPFVDEPYKDFSPGNAKKPETVAAKRAEWEVAKAAWESSVEQRRAEYEAASKERADAYYAEKLSKSRLKAHQSQVMCVSFYDGVTGQCLWADGDERRLIASALERINDTLRSGGRVFGANVLGFDVPFLYRRALLNQMHVGRLVGVGYGGRYEIHSNVIDVLKVYQGPEWGSIPPIGLDMLATCLGIDGKTETEGGARFAEIAATDRVRAEAYAIQDSKLCWEIADRMGLRPEQAFTADDAF